MMLKFFKINCDKHVAIWPYYNVAIWPIGIIIVCESSRIENPLEFSMYT